MSNKAIFRLWNQWELYIILWICISFLFNVGLTQVISIGFIISLLLFFLLFLVGKYFFLINHNAPTKLFVVRVLLLAFVCRLVSIFILAQVLNFYIGIPFLSDKDDYVYHESSCYIADSWRNGGIVFFNSDINFSSGFYSGWPNLSALFMYFFGNSIYVPRIANAIFSTWTCYLAYCICRSFSNDKVSRLVMVLLAVSPLMITFSSLQLKDTFLLFLNFGSIKFSIDIFVKIFKLKSLIFLVLFLLLMIFFRAANVFVILSALVIFILFRISLLIGHMRLIVPFILVLLGLSYGWDYLASIEGIDQPDIYIESRLDHIKNTSIKDANIRASKSSIIKFMGAPAYILFSPFLPPPRLVALPDQETINFSAIGLLFHFSLLPFFIVSIVNVFINRKTSNIPFYILIVFILYKIIQAQTVSSIFDARQSLPAIYLMYLFLPSYFDSHWNKRSIKRITFLVSIVICVAFSYVRLSARGF